MLKSEDRVASYPWSSLCWSAAARGHRPVWFRVDRLLGAHGLREDTPESLAEFQGRPEARRQAEENEDAAALQQIRRGWCFGSEEFREKLLDQFGDVKGEHQTSEIQVEAGLARAERVIAEELQVLGWGEEQLRERRKGDPGKLALEAHLRRQTTLTIKQIAARLSLGTTKAPQQPSTAGCATTPLHWRSKCHL